MLGSGARRIRGDSGKKIAKLRQRIRESGLTHADEGKLVHVFSKTGVFAQPNRDSLVVDLYSCMHLVCGPSNDPLGRRGRGGYGGHCCSYADWNKNR